MMKYLWFLCKFTSWSCGCIEKQIRCWKNCWYSKNIDIKQMNKYNIDFFNMHLFTMRCHPIRTLIIFVQDQNTSLKLPVCKFTSWSCGCIEKQIRCWKNCWYSKNIDKYNKMLCLSSTWFCLSYFLKTNIKFYCIYQYFMSINSFFNTVSVSRYNRPITVTRDPD
jgi:hypothetical protein